MDTKIRARQNFVAIGIPLPLCGSGFQKEALACRLLSCCFQSILRFYLALMAS
jgi:hypothetical protein